MANKDLATRRSSSSERVDAARRGATTNPWYPMILGLLCLPIAIVGVVGTAIEGISSGTPVVGAFVLVCIASLLWACGYSGTDAATEVKRHRRYTSFIGKNS